MGENAAHHLHTRNGLVKMSFCQKPRGSTGSVQMLPGLRNHQIVCQAFHWEHNTQIVLLFLRLHSLIQLLWNCPLRPVFAQQIHREVCLSQRFFHFG